MKDVPYMYRLKPICGLTTRVELPKCMYRLRQIQGSLDPADVIHDNILAKSSFIEEQENHPAVKTLAQRQEAILGQLRNLKRLVEELTRQLKFPPSSSPQQTDHSCMNNRFQEDGGILKIVVKASPGRVPHALLTAIRLWCPCEGDVTSKVKAGALEVKWYCHSTIKGPVPAFTSNDNHQNCQPRVQLSFIWKDVVPGIVEFCIGNSSLWLRGEAVLMNFLMAYLPYNVPSKKSSVVSEVALSELLESCSALSTHKDNSSSTALKKALSEIWKWASNPIVIPSDAHSISVGEMVLWGTLKGLCEKEETLPLDTPDKLAAWFASYSEFLRLYQL